MLRLHERRCFDADHSSVSGALTPKTPVVASIAAPSRLIILTTSKTSIIPLSECAGSSDLSDTRERLQEEHYKLLHVARLSELGQLAATMAHEVNQPLTAIGNYLRAAKRLLATSDQASRRKLDEALDKAADQTARAGEIILRLRSLAKRGESNQRPETIAQIVDEAASLAAIDARLRGVHVQLEPDPAAALVLADRVQIRCKSSEYY